MKAFEKKILDVLAVDGEMTIGQLSKKTYLSRSSIYIFLNKLVEVGQIIKKTAKNNTKLYSLPVLELKSFVVEPVPVDCRKRPAVNDNLINTKQAMALLGVGRTKFYEIVKNPEFPRPYRITSYPAYSKSEVLSFREKFRA